MSCEPDTLLSESSCIAQCIPKGMHDEVQTHLLSLINGGTTDPNALIQAASEFNSKVPAGMQDALQVYLLCQILTGLVGGTDCSPTALAAAAKCYKCVPKGWQKAVQTYLLCQWSEGGQGVCSHPIVLDWLARIAADFVPRPSDDTIRHVCDFCYALDLAGITGKVLALNPVIPDSLQAMAYPLIYQAGNGFSPWINHGFVAADLTAEGIRGDIVVGKYMDTGFIPSVSLTTDSGGMTIYESDTQQVPGQLDEVELGCYSDPDVSGMVLSCYDGAAFSAYCYTTVPNVVQVDTKAFYNFNRSSNVLLEGYRETSATYPPFGPSVFNSIFDQSAANLPTIPVYFMALNLNNAFINPSDKRVSLAAITTDLTIGELADFYEAIYWLRFALGGGYV